MRFLAIKNKKNELKALKIAFENGYAPDNLAFLVEVIHGNYKYDKLIDPETGEPVRIPKKCTDGKTRYYKVDDPASEQDVTLPNLAALFQGKTVFLDFFRCDLSKYSYDAESISLVIEMNTQLDKYRRRLVEVASWSSFIPVVTLKNGLSNFSPNELALLLAELKTLRKGSPVAVRMESFDGYENVLKSCLNADDFFIFDAGERPYQSLVMEYDDLRELGLLCSKLLLCSPRKRDIANRDFEHRSYVTLVDNSAILKYSKFGFQGYGDYGGLRDNLPKSIPVAGRALALLYSGENLQFKSYLCDDPSLGAKGFNLIVNDILSDRAELDPLRMGYVFDELESKIKTGKSFTYQQWVQYTIIQYVQQLALEPVY